MIYLIKASVILGIFYAIYKLLLQNETFFQQNRIFLLLGFISALTIPLLTVPIYIEQNMAVESVITSETFIASPLVVKSIDWMELAIFGYLIGVVFLSIKYLIAMLSLRKLIKSGSKEKIHNMYHVRLEKDTLPFSYFKHIVYNPAQFKPSELDQILSHERIHVKHYHSLDVQFAQLFSIFLWINPIAWLYKKEVQQNLEFIADSHSQRSVENKMNYQQLLLKLSLPNYPLTITNNFYNSLIKKRIIMLTKNKSRKTNQLKLVSVLPLLALFIFNFNTVSIAQNKTPIEVSHTAIELLIKGKVTTIDGKALPDGSIVVKGTQRGVGTNNNGEFAIKVTKGEILVFSKYGMVTQEIIVDKLTHLNVVLLLNKTAPKTEAEEGLEPLYIVDGIFKSLSAVQQIPKHRIYRMSVLKGSSVTNNYGEKGKNGVIIITTKN